MVMFLRVGRGSVQGNTDSIVVNMSADQSVEAVFVQEDKVPVEGNLITNGEFDEKFDGWEAKFQGGANGDASVRSTGGLSGSNLASLNIVNGGTQNWNVELLLLSTWSLEEPMKSPSRGWPTRQAREMRTFQQNGPQFSQYWVQAFTLNSSAQSLGPFYVTPNRTDANTRINFQVGNTTASQIWIDNVVVREVSANTAKSVSNDAIVIYPNPSIDGIINLELDAPSTVSIINADGKKIDNFYGNKGGNQRKIPMVEPGLYFISINDGIKTVTKKVILK